MKKVAAIFILFIIISSGCRSTKFVPEGEYLLNSVTIETDNKEVKPNNVKPFVKQKANVKVLTSVKLHLWIYNLAPKNGDGWLARTLKKMGEEPVVYDEARTIQSEKEITRYLANKGFTSGEVETEKIYRKRRQKVNVTYKLTCNTPYRIAESYRDIKDTTISKIIEDDYENILIKDGDLFDLDVLDDERARITASLKNEGYYDFTKENFHYEVDTTLGDYKVKDFMILKTDTANPSHSYEQYRLGKISMIVGYDAKEALKDIDNYINNMDVEEYKGIRFLSEGKADVKPEILFRNNLLKSGMLYNKKISDQTHSQLSAIKIIRYVNINYVERTKNILDCNIYISLGEPQTFSAEIEGTNISGNFGAAATVGYAHKNLFRGAEQLSSTVTVGREAIIGDEDVYNSKEFGADLKLTYPKFIFPFLDENFIQRSQSETEFSTSLDYQERPEYTRNIITANIMYSWQRKDKVKHQLTPIMINYIDIPKMDSAFRVRIDTTEYLKYSYDDHVILGGKYAITFQSMNDPKTSKYLRLQFESSGNLAEGINLISNREKTTTDDGEESYYDFLGVRYAQYAKFDAATVISHKLNESNTIAYRLQVGLGLPYGNSSQLPFEKRYFGGGANGVRAWMIRSLGPGSYYNEEEVDYFNQSGDINLIASLEYRFKLFSVFEGALFTDAGNTWTIRDYSDQPGAVFEFDNFYKQIAVGIGTGLRVDLNFFVFRLDMAFKVHDPAAEEGSRWVLGDDWSPTTHIAIGYPF